MFRTSVVVKLGTSRIFLKYYALLAPKLTPGQRDQVQSVSSRLRTRVTFFASVRFHRRHRRPTSYIKHAHEHGEYSAKSAYKAQFMGAILTPMKKVIWKVWAPPKVKFFAWLAIQNLVWTADRRERRGCKIVVSARYARGSSSPPLTFSRDGSTLCACGG